MVTPAEKRRFPHERLGGIMEISVTSMCDKACFGCTQASNLVRKRKFITPEQFELACKSLDGYWGVIAMHGGNPCLHPQFEELCAIMRKYVSFEQRGIYTNRLMGNGEACRETFNPKMSNFNVHMDRQAYEEVMREWPEVRPFGLDRDCRHTPPFVALQDVVDSESERWDLIVRCDINQNWSGMVCVVNGEVRAFFCEIAGCMAMLYEGIWPDTGLPAEPGWWRRPIEDYTEQINLYCHRCGIPLRAYGSLAMDENGVEYTSATHADMYKPKVKNRQVVVVDELSQVKPNSIRNICNSMEN
jgi:hypothetical protein